MSDDQQQARIAQLEDAATAHCDWIDTHRRTIDTQRMLIADLERDRDAWRDKAQKLLYNNESSRCPDCSKLGWWCECAKPDNATRPAFPATALNRQWKPVV